MFHDMIQAPGRETDRRRSFADPLASRYYLRRARGCRPHATTVGANARIGPLPGGATAMGIFTLHVNGTEHTVDVEIGRASCRERVYDDV